MSSSTDSSRVPRSPVSHAPPGVPTSVATVPRPRPPVDASPLDVAPVDVPAARPAAGRGWYLSVTAKFCLALAFTALWVGFSVWLSNPWVAQLRPVVGNAPAWTIVTLVAYLPGGIVAFLAASLVLDRQPRLRVARPDTPITVVIAARDEEAGIAATISAVARARYAGPVTVLLADNGSTDTTVLRARVAATAARLDFAVVTEPRPGKAHALNTALDHVRTPYVVTVDADTLLHAEALTHLVSRLESAPPDTVAVAGTVLVRNSRVNLLARMQEWDYYLGIAGVKRMQGLYQATLVAQGAFSLYRTDAIRRIGGWPDAIGEDIVVTWRLMADGSRVFFEPTAVAFTDAPTMVRHFMRQRARWARGMFEGLQAVPPWRQPRPLTRVVAGLNLLIPLLDIGYALIWLPGVLLFVLGYPLIVSAWTLAVLPITMTVYGGLRLYQSRHVFGPLGLKVRRNRIGYVAFLLLYQALCSTAALAGYTQHLTGTRRRWK